MSEATGEDLARQVSGAAGWAYAGAFADRAIRFALFIAVARLVSPAQFGTVVLSLLVVEALQAVLDTGLATALIQVRDPSRAQLDTAFTLTLAAGGLATAALAAGAGPLASALGEPAAGPLLLALSAAPLVNALGAVPLALLQRDLSFRALAARTAGSSLAASLLGVSLAALGWGAWALVARALALVAIGTVAAWIAHPYRPRLGLDAGATRAVAPAGLRLWATGLATQVNGRGFDLLAGVALGVTALAALRIAGQTVLLMAELTVGPMTAVGFAVLSRHRDDPAAFREAFATVATCSALLIFPAFAGLFVVGDPLLPLMFGARWAPAAALLPFMCAVAPALYANLAVLCALFARGRTDLMLKGALVEAAFTLAAGLAGARFGLIGLATAGTLRLYLMVPVNLRWLSRAAGIDPRLLVAPALRAGAAAAAMALVVALAKARLADAVSPAVLTALLLALGIGVYALLLPLAAGPLWRSLRAGALPIDPRAARVLQWVARRKPA